MSADSRPETYQPTVTLQISWEAGQPEPDVEVIVDADAWKLHAIGRVLHHVIAWHQAEEEFIYAGRESLEENHADAARQTLYSVVHDLIYSEEETGLT